MGRVVTVDILSGPAGKPDLKNGYWTVRVKVVVWVRSVEPLVAAVTVTV
jgi:hypothetical protein